MDTEIGSRENPRSLNPRNGGDAGGFVGEIGALFAALIESSTGAGHVPTDVSGSMEFRSGDVVVFVGENSRITGEASLQHVLANRRGAEIIVVGFTAPETADAVTQHYLIRPESDLALIYGLANILMASHWIDRLPLDTQCAEFEQLARFVAPFTTDRVCAETGLVPEELWHFAQTVADGKHTSLHWAKSGRTEVKDQPAY